MLVYPELIYSCMSFPSFLVCEYPYKSGSIITDITIVTSTFEYISLVVSQHQRRLQYISFDGFPFRGDFQAAVFPEGKRILVGSRLSDWLAPWDYYSHFSITYESDIIGVTNHGYQTLSNTYNPWDIDIYITYLTYIYIYNICIDNIYIYTNNIYKKHIHIYIYVHL